MYRGSPIARPKKTSLCTSKILFQRKSLSSICVFVRGSEDKLRFLQANHKMALISEQDGIFQIIVKRAGHNKQAGWNISENLISQ